MTSTGVRLRAGHEMLVRNAFYPLAASSGLALLLYVARQILTESTSFRFLNWNLFLAWLPYCFALLAVYAHKQASRHWLQLLPLGGMWLLFFPNAPYLATDLVHITAARGAPWWFDLGMLVAYALTGSLLGVASLGAMHKLVQEYTGQVCGWLFVLATIGLSGLGMYLGRFVRLNSWDAFTSPRLVATHIHEAMLDPQALFVSGLFAALLLALYCFASLYRGVR